MPTTTRTVRVTVRRVEGSYAVRLGERIRQKREALQITQRELADRIGGAVEGTTVSRWERGRNTPSAQSLQAISEALQTTVDELTGDLQADAEIVANQLDRIERLVEQIAAHHGIDIDEPGGGSLSRLDRPGPRPSGDPGGPGGPGLPADPPDAPHTVDTPQRAEGAQP
jgi:putative transcriptional regulator